MIASLKRLHSPDVPNLEKWIPENGEFSILLQIFAGPEGSPGEESFDVNLCTPGWINHRAQLDGVLAGRNLLIVAEYSYDRIYAYVSEYLAACTGSTWQEVAAKVGRLGRWEFEDYRP